MDERHQQGAKQSCWQNNLPQGLVPSCGMSSQGEHNQEDAIVEYVCHKSGYGGKERTGTVDGELAQAGDVRHQN